LITAGISASGVISERFSFTTGEKTKYYDISSQRWLFFSPNLSISFRESDPLPISAGN
jgi:hypothetical protein